MTGVVHVVVAMKPVESGFAENAVLHGVAGLNVDGCRVGIEERTYTGSGISQQRYSDGRAGLTDGRGKDMEITVSGRWPANMILDDSDEVMLAFPTLHGAGVACEAKWERPENRNVYGKANLGASTGARYGDTGSASRFFQQVSEVQVDE